MRDVEKQNMQTCHNFSSSKAAQFQPRNGDSLVNNSGSIPVNFYFLNVSPAYAKTEMYDYSFVFDIEQ